MALSWRCLRIVLIAGFAGVLQLGSPVRAAAPNESTPQSFADLVAKVMPAVVNVSMTRNLPDTEQKVGRLPLGPPGSPLDEFFKRYQNPGRPNPGELPGNDEGNEHSLSAVGSGFIISPDGYVVTNNHVIDNADSIAVTLQDGTRLNAALIGKDTKTDLALLKITAEKPLPFVEFGNSTAAKVGDWVIAIGNPFGLGGTVSAGILSARGRDIHAGPFDDFLQINASINQGNSGGPTFNLDGKVIGINTAIYSPNGGSVGIGFAIPADLAQPVIEQLRAQGHVDRGWLGVQIQELTPELAESLSLEDQHGALISMVTPGSPAAKSGLRQGDVITGFGGHPVNSLKDLTRVVAGTKVNAVQSMDIWRSGKAQTISVTIGAAPEKPQLASAEGGDDDKPANAPTAYEVLGLQLAPLEAADRARLALSDKTGGVLVTGVKSDISPIHPGDVIVKVGDSAVKKPEDVKRQITAAQSAGHKSVLLLVNRHGNEQFVAMSIKAS